MFDLNNIIRPNIKALKPYSCARDEFKGEASVFLDANENPYNAPYNRYPDPLQWSVKECISEIKGVAKESIFLGNGSDEPIDLMYRAFCEPRVDNVVAINPTYGMYEVCADINDVEYRKVNLDENFQFSAEKLLAKADEHTKVMWLCSPNNPTGNLLAENEIEKLLQSFNGIVVVDEAYIDFAGRDSFAKKLSQHSNLVVLQTFSKAWGSAAIRLGMAFASKEIICVLNKIKYPYNVNILTQRQALALMKEADKVADWVKTLKAERSRLVEELQKLSLVVCTYPTDANFVLTKVKDAQATYNHLVSNGIIVRNRNSVTLCGNCLRITVGTPEENKILLNELHNLE
ncbi:MAG: histidinol-phosphate transaminase [Paludibacteraceae bacterium]|nr:histidinol-phosphate transaminase [Paludibacteraceae bacterium]